MKIALAQLNYHIGNFDFNTSTILHTIEQARQGGAELVVFAELAISGYPAQDFLEFDDFILKCGNSLQRIADACEEIACIVGLPVRNEGPKGKPLFNVAAFCYHGKVEYRKKALLPTYDVFDEYRYFEPAREFDLIHFKGIKIALTICEDIWDVGNNRLYTINPMDALIGSDPDIMINIAASPFNYNQPTRRREVLQANVDQYHLPLIYVNHVGAQTELLFDGGSVAFSADGTIAAEAPYFEEALLFVDTEELQKAPANGYSHKKLPDKIALIHDALVMGIRDYFRKMGFTNAILGLSGGIDSAVTMALAVEALGADHVYGLLMPSQYSSDHSITDAKLLADNLGAKSSIIPIQEHFAVFQESLGHLFEGKPIDVTEENIQARVRGVLLMAVSNKFGYILLNTSNKSEAAVGYGTLYGDMNGGLSVLGDVYKTEVFKLAEYINRNREIIPINTIIKPPSAELRPDQKDSDSLPPYELLDSLLYQYIELRKGPAELLAQGFDQQLIDRVLRLVNTNEYKRFQTPPILRVSPKAFGMGRRMPIVAKYLS